MATMTISEAEKIIDIVSAALQDTSHRHHPVSALKGYDIYQICTALKLQIANEFLLLADKEDFDEQFSDGLKLYDRIPWQIMRFVPDNQVDNIDAEGVFNPIDPSTMDFKDERLASVETGSSFGDYCKSVGSNDPNYWRKIYARIGLEYISTSPKGNDPVRPGSGEEIISQNKTHRFFSFNTLSMLALALSVPAFFIGGEEVVEQVFEHNYAWITLLAIFVVALISLALAFLIMVAADEGGKWMKWADRIDRVFVVFVFIIAVNCLLSRLGNFWPCYFLAGGAAAYHVYYWNAKKQNEGWKRSQSSMWEADDGQQKT